MSVESEVSIRPALTPAQQAALQRLLDLWSCSPVFVFWARAGLGRTTVLRELHGRLQHCGWVDTRDWFEKLRQVHPQKIEETFVDCALEKLAQHQSLIIDDFERIDCIVGRCNYYYPRRGVIEPALQTLVDRAAAEGKKVVLSSTGRTAGYVDDRCLFIGYNRFGEEDYAVLFRHSLGEKVTSVDVPRIFRFAPKLTAHQLHGALEVLRRQEALDTEKVMKYLEDLKMASNINIGEVRAVELEDLKGVDNVLESLKRFVITPLVEEKLARDYGIRPKRGVLLFGPPGTGKTTVGRALARRLRSRFFRIDGTFIARTPEFYQKVSRVFENARDNAPSLVFIDDCDTIFEDKDEHGLYRYLLTLLDGLESEEMSGVSVMMTAMDITGIPPALIRSGRIELWLEMRRPDAGAREAILEARCRELSERHGPVDLPALARVTDGFTGADLERMVHDGKALMISELAEGKSIQDPTSYLMRAVEGVRANLEVIAQASQAAEAKQRFRIPNPFAAYSGHDMGQSGDDSPPTG